MTPEEIWKLIPLEPTEYGEVLEICLRMLTQEQLEELAEKLRDAYGRH